jgi:hypothetical protein
MKFSWEWALKGKKKANRQRDRMKWQYLVNVYIGMNGDKVSAGTSLPEKSHPYLKCEVLIQSTGWKDRRRPYHGVPWQADRVVYT